MDPELKAALIGGVVGAIATYAAGKGLYFGLPRQVEHVYVVAEGQDVGHAFRRGQRGKGTLLRIKPPRTKLFDLYFDTMRALGFGTPGSRRQATRIFFHQQAGWEAADDAGIVMRWSSRKEPLRLTTARISLYRSEIDAWMNTQIWGTPSPEHMAEVEQKLGSRVVACLTDPGEPLDGSGQFPPTDLGDDPEFTAVCVRAIAIMCLGENPEGKAAVLELPPSRSLWSRLLRRRRFLFFGERSVRG